ncbi:MAG: hypothetical protein HRU19_21130 [Pseudobacteriovorax sp.]|nr:hypothetical protein [Pseudobacteriovorax sp.]
MTGFNRLLGSFFFSLWFATTSFAVDFGFDHSWNRVFDDFRYVERLNQLGFAIAPKTVEHPGSQVCKFIVFPGGQVTFPSHFLEFCLTTNEKDYLERHKRFFRGPDAERRIKGSSLVLYSDLDLKRQQVDIQKRLPGFEVKYSHKNYEWKRDSKSILPGWNHLFFGKKRLLTGLRVTVGKKDPRDTLPDDGPVAKKPTILPHPNSAEKIIGLILYDNFSADFSNLSRLINRKPKTDRMLVLPDGTFIQSIIVGEDESIDSMFVGKKQNLAAIMVKVKSLATFESFASKLNFKKTSFNGVKAYHIPHDEWHWDLIVVEDIPKI